MKNKIIKKENLIYIILIIFSIFVGVISRVKLSNIYSLNSDMIEHYYHMRKYYDNKKIPVTGAYLVGGDYIADEYNSNSEVFDENIPNIPGGYFYIEYMLYYFLGGKNLYTARILYFVAMALFSFIFLFWIYKTFDIKILAIITSLIFVNITFFTIGNRFYNPHTAFILSFISIPIIMQYAINKDNTYKYSVLIFPLLALEAMGHLATFFNIIPTIIAYLIIRWQKTKKYIIPLLIGVFISFLLYLPYLISEIQNNFPNLHNLINLKSTVKPIRQPPQIWSVLFFPTNEPNWNYGNGIAPIFTHWFNGNPLLIFSFIFYIISIFIGLSSFVILIKDYFKNKLENKENLIFKETALIYLLYIILTVIIFMILNLGAARGRYFLNIFPLTFIPLIYLIKKSENKKLFKLLLIYAFINPLAVYIQIFHIYENEDKNGWNFMMPHVEKIIEDAKDKTFDLSTNDYYPYVLLKIENKNFRIDTNANIKYHLIKSFDKEFDSSGMQLIYSNKQYLTFKEYKIN